MSASRHSHSALESSLPTPPPAGNRPKCEHPLTHSDGDSLPAANVRAPTHTQRRVPAPHPQSPRQPSPECERPLTPNRKPSTPEDPTDLETAFSATRRSHLGQETRLRPLNQAAHHASVRATAHTKPQAHSPGGPNQPGSHPQCECPLTLNAESARHIRNHPTKATSSASDHSHPRPNPPARRTQSIRKPSSVRAPTHTQGEIRHLCHRRPTSPPLGVRRHAHQTDVAALPLSKCAPPHTLSRRERANPGKMRANAHTFQVTALPSPQSASHHAHFPRQDAAAKQSTPAIKPLSQSATTAHSQMCAPTRTLSRQPHSRAHKVRAAAHTFQLIRLHPTAHHSTSNRPRA